MVKMCRSTLPARVGVVKGQDALNAAIQETEPLARAVNSGDGIYSDPTMARFLLIHRMQNNPRSVAKENVHTQ